VLVAAIFGLTLVVPLWVLGHTAGNWRAALSAWWQFVRVLLWLAVPAFILWLVSLVSRT
jgi:hypothetical protein